MYSQSRLDGYCKLKASLAIIPPIVFSYSTSRWQGAASDGY